MTDRDRKRIVAQWRRSGLSAVRFAPTVGLKAWTLYGWRRKLAQVGTRTSGRAPAFVELLAASPMSTRHADTTIAVELPRGITVRVGRDFDPLALRRAVDALLD